jgi:hydrogenase maturation protein HypF
MTAGDKEGRRIELRGTVQGVGMRPWIHRVARAQGVAGRVWNHAEGVTIEAFAARARLEAFVHALSIEQPPAARTEAVDASPIPLQELSDFVIVDSRGGGGRSVSIPPDLCTCADCLAEVFDPDDRRFRYPFTNCTNCGPRFTIARDVPYDRATTTMAPFAMCAVCQREYDDPANRRFHAQPNACPTCGPRLSVVAPDGTALQAGDDAIAYAAAEIAAGRIVAVKGLGGFHLACDATSSAAVARLRLRKHRDEKPLAVMVRTVDEARRVGIFQHTSLRLLESVERPIVLVRRRHDAPIANEVAPRNPLIGVMLAYTPLHHLLLADAGVPLVMTSGNVSDEPIAYRNEEALVRLGAIADVLLVHDREIVTRCDESVATVINGAPAILRRSRGFVPRPITLRDQVETPVLACGALLKNTFCLAYGREAWLGPHIGDMENAETYDAYGEAIAAMERFTGVRGEIVAHDLHPDYLSTRYARDRGGRLVAVQHHHAHVASAIAEHGVSGPVLGVAFDGTGFGADGTAWGGEFLVGDARAVRRVATMRPVRLPGGDAAIRQPWRIAVALLDDAMAFEPAMDGLPLFRQLASRDVAAIRQMLIMGLNTPAAHGLGRYFDGIGALLLARPHARYEGQVAFELNMAAADRENACYPYRIDREATPIQIDCRPVVRAVVRDMRRGSATPVIAARFHNTLAAATAAIVRECAVAGTERSRPKVVLTGGCFQNVRLAERTRALLAADHDVYLHHRVPPGDGGIALGQAVIAAASRG